MNPIRAYAVLLGFLQPSLLGSLNPFKGSLNPVKRIKSNIRDLKKAASKLTKIAHAPVRAAFRADPLYQKLRYGTAGSPTERFEGAVSRLYRGDPIARNVGISEEQAITAAKYAAIAAGAYYGGAALMGGGAGTGTAAGTAAKSSTAAKVGATAGAVGAGAQAYGTVQQRKAIKQAEEAARLEAAQLEEMIGQRPKAMPTASDADIRLARRRSLALQMRRRGRASTILTDESRAPLG